MAAEHDPRMMYFTEIKYKGTATQLPYIKRQLASAEQCATSTGCRILVTEAFNSTPANPEWIVAIGGSGPTVCEFFKRLIRAHANAS